MCARELPFHHFPLFCVFFLLLLLLVDVVVVVIVVLFQRILIVCDELPTGKCSANAARHAHTYLCHLVNVLRLTTDDDDEDVVNEDARCALILICFYYCHYLCTRACVCVCVPCEEGGNCLTDDLILVNRNRRRRRRHRCRRHGMHIPLNL